MSAAMAFLLALFSHIVNHMVIRLQGALYEKENPNKLLQTNLALTGIILAESWLYSSVCILLSKMSHHYT